MEDLLKDLDRIYTGVQHLSMQPTKSNSAIVLDVLQVLEKVYAHIKQEGGEAE